MVLVWNNIKSFQRHLEDMRLFHQSHNNNMLAVELKMFNDVPIPFDVIPQRETGLIRSITDTRGKIIIVPIWNMTLSRGSQN